ncbi:MAG: hypothetical protein WKF41_13060 [Gaiellaceae bacterium]
MSHFVDERVPEASRRAREVTIIAQDPSVRDADGKTIRAAVSIPVDLLEPGPRGQRFHVVDYDAGLGKLAKPCVFLDPEAEKAERGWTFVDRFVEASDTELETSATFHAQNVYAIAARTLAVFEFALGRRLSWGFSGHQLYLVPHAFREANAYYSAEDRALLFGYIDAAGGERVYTCLSHDIVAHETTHAVLDGLRPRFLQPGLPDQGAFHEGFADIVALLSVFSVGSLIESALGSADARGRIQAASVAPKKLEKNVLFRLAKQFGEATSGVRGSALRRSLELPTGGGWRADPAFEEVHRRGEVIVAPMLRALLRMWTGRLDALIYRGGLDRARAAEEGAKAAKHLLHMAIRAIDYAPAVELEFEDFLDAMLVADEVVAPDDQHRYRDSVRTAFAEFEIEQPDHPVISLAKQPLLYSNINYVALRSDPNEVFRFIWHNAELLGIDREYYLRIESVRPSVRVGPDGLVVNETVADYVQTLNASVAEARKLGVDVPADIRNDLQLQFWGGGTLIFDQFGMAKFHQQKPLNDWKRQTQRIAYLIRHGYYDGSGRLGFSFGTPRGLRFAEFHESDTRVGEDW